MKFPVISTLAIAISLLTCNNASDRGKTKTKASDKAPLVSIVSKKEILDEPKTEAKLSIKQGDKTIFNANIGIEIRGAVSQMFYEKKSYGFELQAINKDEDAAMPILGLPKGSDWVLHGPFGDKTLLRNAVAYRLSNNIGRYAAKTQFVELEINGDYMGFYVLMEKLKHGPGRINISKLSPTDSTQEAITGGYVLKIDKTAGGGHDDFDDYTSDNSFRSRYDAKAKISQKSKTFFMYEYPKAKNITKSQARYIQQYVADFEKTLASDHYKDPENGYQKYIDIDSFVDYFILTELMQNHDGYRLSTYLQKDRNQKLAMGPIWDFDIAFGSDAGFCDGMNQPAWVFQYNQYCGGDTWVVPFWWKKLVSDPAFMAKVKARWKALRNTQLADNELEKTISDFATEITENNMVARNFERWAILKKQITPNSTTGSHQKEISRMKSWLTGHAHWIDIHLAEL